VPIQTKPFEEQSDFDQLADSLRRQVAGLVLTMQQNAIYQSMEPIQQVEVVIAGLTCGLVGACFATIKPRGRDQMMKMIRNYLPQAREHAEAIVDGD
jgi:hypothetical protein